MAKDIKDYTYEELLALAEEKKSDVINKVKDKLASARAEFSKVEKALEAELEKLTGKASKGVRTRRASVTITAGNVLTAIKQSGGTILKGKLMEALGVNNPATLPAWIKANGKANGIVSKKQGTAVAYSLSK